MYMLKISSKSDNVATSYKRLEMAKIAASRYFQPITARNVKICTIFRCLLFLYQLIPTKYSGSIHDINSQNLLFTFLLHARIKVLQKVIFIFFFAISTDRNFFIKSVRHPVN